MRKLIFTVLIIFFTINACNDSSNININENDDVIVNKSLFDTSNTENYTIINATISGNFLTIKIAASGCDSKNWKATLVDRGEILESFPIQRSIKLHLKNEELCLAYFEKEYTFDITELVENYPAVIFSLTSWDKALKFE